jgi:predicted RNase H-like HicB family nuclease
MRRSGRRGTETWTSRITGPFLPFNAGSYSAYVPNLPGCVAVGQATPEAAKRLIPAAIETHIRGMIEDGLVVPEPSSRGEYVQAVA